MTLEEYWAKWQQHWHLRQNGPTKPIDHGETMVMGRLGDQGDYTVENCRVITHRANTLERDHTKCVDKLKGKVGNPRGSANTPKHRKRGARISTPSGEFANCSKAAEHFGFHRSSIWHRVKSPLWKEWFWAE